MKKHINNLITSRLRLGILLILGFIFWMTFGDVFQTSQQAQTPFEAIELFTLAGTPKNNSTVSFAGVREQEIKIVLKNADFENAQKLRFTLLDGISYEAVRRDSEGFARFADDEFTWQGKISGENNWKGDVVLSVKGNALSGLIYSPNAVYEIIPQKDFKHLLVEIDQNRFPSCGGAITPNKSENINKTKNRQSSVADKSLIAEPKNFFDKTQKSIFMPGSSQSSSLADNGSQIDVLVVYTASVRSALGGTTQAQAFAQQSISTSNTAYQNSGISTRLRLVQTMEVGYADNSNISAALNWVTGDATVAAARNTSKADMVSLLTENANDACGVAWLMTNVSPAFSSSAFSVTQRTCAVGNLSFPHELGHNQASDHNPENANPPSALAYPYAYGHWNASGNFRTVMSYNNPCPSCVRIPYFSNPSVNYNGFPTGIVNQRENARVINNTSLTISQFRESGGGGGTCPSTPISVGQTINSSLSTSDCIFTGTNRYVDVYSFNGTAGQQIAVSMSSATFDTYLYLVNSSNQTLAEDDDGGGGTNSRIPATSGFFTLPANGTYTIYATAYFENSTGAYSLNLSTSAANPCDQTSPISVNQTINGTLTNTDCVVANSYYTDKYLFSGTAGQQIVIAMNSAAVDSYLVLYTSGGQFLAADNDGGGGGTNSRIPSGGGSFTLPATGSYMIEASTNPAFQTGAYSVTLSHSVVPLLRRQFDFDGDGKTDIGIYRPSNGQWWINRSSNNSTFATTFGLSSDKFVPADYTGDGKTDVAFYRPSNGQWFVLRSENFTFYGFGFGVSTDVPAPGDFDGDGRADAAVFRPSTSTWYISRSTDYGITAAQFGANGDVPVIGNYDGDARDDIAVFRPSTGVWWLLRSSLGLIAYQFGAGADKPVVGDFTGDGKADAAVWRPSNGTWFVLRSENLSFFGAPFGANGDIPLSGDFDGDGKNDPAVFRPSNSTWYVNKSSGGTLTQSFGIGGDKPIPSAFVP